MDRTKYELNRRGSAPLFMSFNWRIIMIVKPKATVAQHIRAVKLLVTRLRNTDKNNIPLVTNYSRCLGVILLVDRLNNGGVDDNDID